MMNMREKIARAIAPADFAFYEKMTGITGVDVGVNNPMTFHAFEKADAVLDALLEPTEGMLEAGESALPDYLVDYVTLDDLGDAFQAMIRAAKEGK